MRFRARLIAAAVSSALLATMIIPASTLAQETDASAHPLVGSWVVVTGAGEPSDGADLYVVHADGTVTDVTAGGIAGVGSWLPSSDVGSVVTILTPQSDEEGLFSGHRVARGDVEVAPDGDSFM
jgi:hypothetical protein